MSEWLQGEKLSMDDVHQLGSQLLEALLAAHEMKLLHRDLKPQNIRVSRLLGGRLQVKVLDFGLARYSANSRRQEAKDGNVAGTVFYMSPEQLEHQPMDARSDLYAVACVIYEVLAGFQPFTGETVRDVIDAHLEHRVKPLQECNPDLPAEPCDWVMWTMNHSPKDRPANARVALEYFNGVFENIKADQQITRAIESGRVIGTSSHLPIATPLASMEHFVFSMASSPSSSSKAIPTVPKSLDHSKEHAEAPKPASDMPARVEPEATAARKLAIAPFVAGIGVLLALLAFFLFRKPANEGDSPGSASTPDNPPPHHQAPAPNPAPVPPAAARPTPPLAGRLLARYIASDSVLGIKDAKSPDAEIEVGMGVTVWNDLVASGGMQPFKASNREPGNCTKWSIVRGDGLLRETAVVSFRESQQLQAIFPFDSPDGATLDMTQGGGGRPGHTLVLVVRSHEVKRDNRLLTLHRSDRATNKTGSYQLICKSNRILRFQLSNASDSFEGLTLPNPLEVGKFSIITMVVSDAQKQIRFRCRSAGGGAPQEASMAISSGAPALNHLFIGSRESAGSGNFSPDCFADVAEIMVYRSALDESLVVDLERQLIRHYFEQ